NLSLRVLGKRNDGFHEVATILQTISLHDILIFEPAGSGRIEVFCDDPSVPIDKGNLIRRAAEALHTRDGAKITLKKLIPIGGGLGGGSSNAAVTLIGLSRLWSLDVSIVNLREIASSLGSDVPFFLYGGSALATGTGTTVESLPDVRLGMMIIVTPNVKVSTRFAYDGLGAANLTSTDAERILLNYRLGAETPVESV